MIDYKLIDTLLATIYDGYTIYMFDYDEDLTKVYNSLNPKPNISLDDFLSLANDIKLDLVKQDKIKELEEAKDNDNASGCNVMIDGVTYKFFSTKTDADKYKDALDLYNLSGEDYVLVTYDGIITIPNSEDNYRTIILTIGTKLKDNYFKFKQLEQIVLNANTIEEVENVQW